MSTSVSHPYESKVLICKDKSCMAKPLHELIIKSFIEAQSRGQDIFSIALSGGSLPSFLSGLEASFQESSIDPQWGKWHVLLADERCVASTHADSNLKALREIFLNFVPIPKDQIYGLNDETLLNSSSSELASIYETEALKPVLEKGGNKIDCTLLGFGPDGHTCSLFPNHSLLDENVKLVASLDDSPKPPPSRITLTFPVLNTMCRNVIFVGAGDSKSPILNSIFSSVTEHQVRDGSDVKDCLATLQDPAPYPCGMVRPEKNSDDHNLTFIVDTSAFSNISISKL